MSSYNDATARTAAGQPFTVTLADGTVVRFTVKITATNATSAQPAMLAAASPTWSGSAFGNSAFIGIPNRPVLYTATDGVDSTVEISSIVVTPPAGVAASQYAFVIADGEATGGDTTKRERIIYTTNGTPWQKLVDVAPLTGSSYPTLTGLGTTTATETGISYTSFGSYVLGTNNPTRISVATEADGKQGVLFAIRFASISLNKTITGARVNAADQFRFNIKSTTNGSVMASGTTSGTGRGPFTAAVLQMSAGVPMTLEETMASGSVSTLAQYQSRLTCTNASGVRNPDGVVTTSYNYGSLNFGDIISCVFNNTPFPHLNLTKALGAGGRQFANDQFVMQIARGATVDATTTTTGSGTTIANGTTGATKVTAGTAYTLSEAAAGSTVLSQYTSAMVCTNANGSSTTTLPTTPGGTITPKIGDVISCTITNTRKGSNASLMVVKSSAVVSDPVRGTNNPMAIPGAIVRYTITVTNIGPTPVDAGSVAITDPLPANITYDALSGVTWANGTTASGLTGVSATFSNRTGGVAPYSYTPASRYDPLVKGVRVVGVGTMAGSTGSTAQPSFSISFLGRVN